MPRQGMVLARRVEVLESCPITPSTHMVRVERPDGFRFAAGQHAVLRVQTREGREASRFSIASPPHEDHLLFATKSLGSLLKEAFGSLSPGDTVEVEGPHGGFTLPAGGEPVVLLCGGIGITPMRSILLDAARREDPPPITLFYSNSSRDEIAFKEDLDRAAEHPRIEVQHILTREAPEKVPGQYHTGRIGEEDLRGLPLDRARFLLSGPPQMVEDLTGHLERLGVEDVRIRTEVFGGY